MNVLLVSQCSKRALTETRRILDQFAERCGDRTWQTAITMDGLDTLRKLLRKTARKNTAVACHWIRGKDHSELMWVVGDANQFNSQGAVPTNTTERDVLRAGDENNWHTGEAIKLFSQMAALLHDLGKSSIAFQQRLRGKRNEKNIFRHEWVSLRLFLAFVGSDDDKVWLQRVAQPSVEDDRLWSAPDRYERDGLDKTQLPFKDLPPVAAAIAWLVVTHHRLPVKPEFDIDGKQLWLGKKNSSFNATHLVDLLQSVSHEWNEIKQDADKQILESYWQIENSLPVVLPKWRTQAAKLATRLLALHNTQNNWLDNPYVMHVSRLSLMLADHYYSSLPPDSSERVRGDKHYSIYANTHKDGTLKQPLDEHLLGVAKLAGSICHYLPDFELHLPRLAKHRGLKKRSESDRFRWQDKAADAANTMRSITAEQGAFIVNMASTGCGKTLANARVLYNLADPAQGMRATFALGLRTLTLQTGRSYREDLHLGEDELAIRVGGSASRQLFEFYEAKAEASGSASIQDLIEEDSHVLYEGQYADHPLLSKAMADNKIRALLSAPMLVCTIDHLMPATEAQRAGRQIAPMLRLMSSDLVLDELDDFDLADLPALTRLVYWAGLLGARILLSSATLPPSLVQGMFQAYRAGRQIYQQNRGPQAGVANTLCEIPCLWIDEFSVHHHVVQDADSYANAHDKFVQQRVKALLKSIEKDGPKRCGVLVPLDFENHKNKKREQIYREFAQPVIAAIINAHNAHHEICPVSGKYVSFGLVRMANIEPLFEVAQELFSRGAPENYCVHLCVYHSRFPLLIRSAIEHQLDTTLNRRNPDLVYKRADIRQLINGSSAQNHLFVVLGSPVTEVGRDHDYDWAVVEPSSMRSLIQLAGRVQRHRQKTCTTPNVFIFDRNLKSFTASNGKDGYKKAAFVRPGFEDNNQVVGHEFRLNKNKLQKLLREYEYQFISSIPRISPPVEQLRSREYLVDLEHARMKQQMLPLPVDERELNAAHAWQNPQASLTWALPQHQTFRDSSGQEEITLVFLPNDDEDELVVHRVHEEAKAGKPAIYTTAESQIEKLTLNYGIGINPWGQHDLMALLVEQAVIQDISLEKIAEKFTTVNVRSSKQGWRFHSILGFAEQK